MKDETKERFDGSRIRAIRLERGLTQGKLAHRAGSSIKYVGFIEQGLKTPSIEMLFAFAAALNCLPGDLLPNSAETPVVVGRRIFVASARPVLRRFNNLEERTAASETSPAAKQGAAKGAGRYHGLRAVRTSDDPAESAKAASTERGPRHK